MEDVDEEEKPVCRAGYPLQRAALRRASLCLGGKQLCQWWQRWLWWWRLRMRWLKFTEYILVERAGVHKSLGYHRKAGIGCHLRAASASSAAIPLLSHHHRHHYLWWLFQVLFTSAPFIISISQVRISIMIRLILILQLKHWSISLESEHSPFCSHQIWSRDSWWSSPGD